MLLLTTLITKETINTFKSSPENIENSKMLLNFLKEVKPNELDEGVRFEVEYAKDENSEIYQNVQLQITGSFIKNGRKFLVGNGIAVDVQPLINFLSKQK